MLYIVNKHTKEHRRYMDAEEWADADCVVVGADPDGWIEWHGGECPLPDKQPCELKFNTGETAKSRIPGLWTWAHNENALPIIAYRPILDTKPEPPTWDGEGLPPVGCECEVLGAPGGTYCPAVIDYIDGRHCVWHWLGSAPDDTMHNRVERMRFRPIRSEEDRAVDEMMGIWSNTPSIFAADGMRALYRAGYRKTGGE